MKKVLVIGDDSYIGMSFEAFARDKLEIKMVSSRNNAWREVDFAGYDSVLHCAGIAHISRDPKMESLYYEVNCNLAVDVANKAKSENVKQFIFLSSMLIYGSKNNEINHITTPNPDNFYGNSKLKAEQELQKLSDNDFKLCIVRPPMVYGKGSKGNFPKLVKLARKTPLFPNFPNKRNMIYIDNLCNFICDLVNNENEGVFLPQNIEYVNTTELVRCIRECHGKRLKTTRVFNPLIRFLSKRMSVFNKVFGDLWYVKQGNESGYCVVGFEESVRRSVL
jgi:UDP-glucose 4-epimerase